MCYCPTPTLYLNLALTGDCAFQLSPKKPHSVWFISVLKSGDINVLKSHLHLVIPVSYLCHYTNLCPDLSQKRAHTHTQTHTHTTHTPHTQHTHTKKTHTHTHTTHTHTHTHTHVGFCGLWGLSIGVMVFILNKLYVLLPYTYPIPKLSPQRRLCISTFPKKTSLCMIYKRFELRGHRQCPHKTPSNCNTSVIPMSLYKFVSS